LEPRVFYLFHCFFHPFSPDVHQTSLDGSLNHGNVGSDNFPQFGYFEVSELNFDPRCGVLNVMELFAEE
jgi:hypothetical protein